MTNHLHLVVQQKDGKLSDWVRDFKKFTSKKLGKMIMENPQESRRNYIHENPVRAGIVENPEDNMYSNARNYAGLDGLIAEDYW